MAPFTWLDHPSGTVGYFVDTASNKALNGFYLVPGADRTGESATYSRARTAENDTAFSPLCAICSAVDCGEPGTRGLRRPIALE